MINTSTTTRNGRSHGIAHKDQQYNADKNSAGSGLRYKAIAYLSDGKGKAFHKYRINLYRNRSNCVFAGGLTNDCTTYS